MNVANIVLGSYINGHSIIQELYENGVRNLYVIDIAKDVAGFSNRIDGFFRIKNNKDEVYKILVRLHDKYELIVAYPTQDIYVEHLSDLYAKIEGFCFIPFNPKNAVRFQDKLVQYQFCQELEIPCPKIMAISHITELEKLYSLRLPFLIKPTKRDNLSGNVFRTLVLNNAQDIHKTFNSLKGYLKFGIRFVASEIIPGDGSNIYAYTAYRSKSGAILGEWIGKKLAQFPNDYGVFSSASNQGPDILIDQSRKLLNGMDLRGINEPEYKYDYRDGLYKLMEINLRPMMWHRVGALSGVPLNYIQYLDATNQIGANFKTFTQDRITNIHYVYLNHELINLVTRPGYYRSFCTNLFSGDRRIFALWDREDPVPLLRSFLSIAQRVKKKRVHGKHSH